jgi:hypothetical protein
MPDSRIGGSHGELSCRALIRYACRSNCAQQMDQRERTMKRASRGTGTAAFKWSVGLSIGAAMMTIALGACSPASVTPETVAAAPVGSSRPNVIVVYNFAVSPSEVTLNQSVVQRIYRNVASPQTTQDEQHKVADQAAQALSDTLVTKLQGLGFTVQNQPRGTPAPDGAIVVDGQFVNIDEGNRLRRLVIGFGAGASKLDTDVQVNRVSGETQETLLSFKTHAESGKMPGAAVTMGVGAAAQGGVTAAAAAGSAGVGGIKTYRSTTEFLADNTADQIFNYLTEYFASQGWISLEQAKAAKIEQTAD